MWLLRVEGNRSCLVCLHLIPVGDVIINRWKTVILATGLTPPHLCTFPKLGSGSANMIYFVLNDFKGEEVVARFIYTGGIIDNHCWNFLLIKL